MSKQLRIAIAGAGQMGLAHAEAFHACGATVVAVVDRDAARARQLASSCGAAAFGTVEEALREGPDALSICLPHSLHFDAAMAAVQRDVALLIEKPHCTSLEESRALRQACAERGVPAMAGFTHRFLATSLRLKALVASGRLGRIDLAVDRLVANSLGDHAPAWYRERALAGGGIAMIGMIHSIDRLRWLLDAEITRVFALTRPPVSSDDVENTALALLEFSNGAQASLIAHRSPVTGYQRAHRYELFGEHLNASCSVGTFAHQELEFVGPGGPDREVVTNDRPFVAEIRVFTSALAEGRAPNPGLDEAEIALGAVLAIYESARSCQPINLRDFLGSALSPQR
ncbi:MAG: Gfo/Idh/MocA family oxidoreductase [Opitutaceae bacterium]|nr:Gfo/Idh/MocA family oxidoreductase [Opitutaceae bacterium]